MNFQENTLYSKQRTGDGFGGTYIVTTCKFLFAYVILPFTHAPLFRYVSDSMGHPPAISDNSFTAKMPVDVDEVLFVPSSTSIPAPSSDDHASKYFGLKVRCVHNSLLSLDGPG